MKRHSMAGRVRPAPGPDIGLHYPIVDAMADVTDAPAGETTRDWSETLLLPKTDFPMRAGLPKREPEIMARWAEDDMHRALREAAKGREPFTLHDGPPYANGHLHIGHALNKILKDVVTRSHADAGLRQPTTCPAGTATACRSSGRSRSNTAPRARTRTPGAGQRVPPRNAATFAEHWIDVQREEFKRLGVVGDWDRIPIRSPWPIHAEADDRRTS